MQRKYVISTKIKRVPVTEYMSESLGFSSRQAKKLLKDKKVWINGKIAYWDNKLKGGDSLEIDLSEEPRKDIIPDNIGLAIIYEDKYILAVNKPPYMLVHPTPNHQTGTLLNAVAHYFREREEKSSLRLLNRLDMNTSGVVVIPKSAEVHSKLDKMMKSGSIKKLYTAVIEGVIDPERGSIDLPIGKDDADPIRRTVRNDGLPAKTIYETLKKFNGNSLVCLKLVTGRTHQIRVHLAWRGHPITGDELYGKASKLIGRQALHASEMELPHPCGSGILKLHAELPEDIAALVARLELE